MKEFGEIIMFGCFLICFGIWVIMPDVIEFINQRRDYFQNKTKWISITDELKSKHIELDKEYFNLKDLEQQEQNLIDEYTTMKNMRPQEFSSKEYIALKKIFTENTHGNIQ